MVNLLQTALTPWIYVLNLLRVWQKIVSTSFDHTPNMSAFQCELTTYLSMSGVKKLIKNNGPANSSESSLIKYFKQLDEPVVQDFIKHPSKPQCEMAFLNFFTYFSSNDPTKRIHPPFINSYASLVEDPSNSTYEESIPSTGQAGGNYPSTCSIHHR
jgi:hypothetical protein